MSNPVLTICVALLLAGCGSDNGDGSSKAAGRSKPAPLANDAETIMDNVASAGPGLRDYGMLEPTLHPSPASAANELTKPLAYRKALFGYFDDADVLSQFTAKERAQMSLDGNAFHAGADLDRDGAAETYRTGYFQTADGAIGLFLAVFERGKQVDLWTQDNVDQNVLWISTRDGLTLFHCNCPETGTVEFSHKRLRVKWTNSV